MRSSIRLIAALCVGVPAALSSGCTFVTSCPDIPTGGGAFGGAPGSPNNSGGAPDDVDGTWSNVTPDFSEIMQTCGPMTGIWSKPDEDSVIAGVSNHGLWATSDGGAHWKVLGQGAGSDPMVHGTTALAFDPDVPDRYWVSGIYGNGLFRTDDNGDTFKHLGDTYHDDFVSVDFSDKRRRTFLLSGHEMQLLRKSTDGGDTWSDLTSTIPSNVKYCGYPLIIEPNVYLLGCGGRGGKGTPAILRSEDAGQTWTQIFENGGAAEPLIASDGAIYWAEEDNTGLAVSRDNGESFSQVVAGTVMSVKPVELPDKRIATLGGDAIIVSSDLGKTWKKATPPYPFRPSGFTYSPYQKAFFLWYFTCAATPQASPTDAVQRFDFDYETQ
ncbi:MAG TPA: hypothetical protein VER11_23210 [Polyangiaceae bacterium]|nr:hypothetical protein [Polyangiaceae bacterium]